MRKSTLLGFSFVALAMAGFAQSSTLITFDDLPGMVNSPGSAVPVASQLSDQLLGSHNVVFSSGAGYVAVVDHVAPTVSAPNVIGGTSVNGTLSYGSLVEIKFMVDDSTKGIVDWVKIRGDKAPAAGSATMTAYDAAGSVLGSVMDVDSDLGLTLELNLAGIHRVELTQQSQTIGFDDLEFSDVEAVPEPFTMVILASGALALLRKRR